MAKGIEMTAQMTGRTAAGRNVTISDRAGLAKLIGEVIDARYDPGLARAARESRVIPSAY